MTTPDSRTFSISLVTPEGSAFEGEAEMAVVGAVARAAESPGSAAETPTVVAPARAPSRPAGFWIRVVAVVVDTVVLNVALPAATNAPFCKNSLRLVFVSGLSIGFSSGFEVVAELSLFLTRDSTSICNTDRMYSMISDGVSERATAQQRTAKQLRQAVDCRECQIHCYSHRL